MKLFGLIIALLSLLAFSTKAPAQGNSSQPSSPADAASSSDDAASLQNKANEVQARIRANPDESDQMKRAVKINEVPLAREILLRNGFNAKDLENAKISLRTGGGKGGEDTIEISVTCCNPKEITVRRTLENFTKTNR
ncbi:MAG TPA: hypothetical protein VJU77_05345 [Chthoniobacterales bacterium]|nr:hypothetical protein [Chthoniobacterales bacterium]